MTNKEDMERTAELMLSDDYKKRFQAEHRQLFLRTWSLAQMLDKWRSGKLDFEPTCEYFLLEEQLKAMKEYLEILDERAIEEGIEIL